MEGLVNDLKGLGKKVEDKDFSHKFMRCLPKRFEKVVSLLVRTGLDTMTPNQILGDIMTDDLYRDEEEKEEKQDEKKDEKKKSVAFKASSSSKGMVKQESSCDDDSSFSIDELDSEKVAFFVKKFGKLMIVDGCQPSISNRQSTMKKDK
jgi:hypothetical protein